MIRTRRTEKLRPLLGAFVLVGGMSVSTPHTISSAQRSFDDTYRVHWVQDYVHTLHEHYDPDHISPVTPGSAVLDASDNTHYRYTGDSVVNYSGGLTNIVSLSVNLLGTETENSVQTPFVGSCSAFPDGAAEQDTLSTNVITNGDAYTSTSQPPPIVNLHPLQPGPAAATMPYPVGTVDHPGLEPRPFNQTAQQSDTIKLCSGTTNTSSTTSDYQVIDPALWQLRPELFPQLVADPSGTIFEGHNSVSYPTHNPNLGEDANDTYSVDITVTGTHFKPTAAFNWKSTSDKTVTLDGSPSHGADPTTSLVSYNWSFGDGSSGTSTSPSISHTFPLRETAYNVSLVVVDSYGVSSDAITRQVFSPRTFDIRMMTFIPSNYISAPHPEAFCRDGVVFRRLIGAGDDRGFDRNAAETGAYRSLQRVSLIEDADVGSKEIRELTGSGTFDLGISDSYVESGSYHGQPIGALNHGTIGRIDPSDDDHILNDCRLHHDHNKGMGDIAAPGVTTSGQGATVKLSASVRNGLIYLSPRIDYSIVLKFDVSGDNPVVSISGIRDNFPAYELYVNSDPVYLFAPHGAAPNALPVLSYGLKDIVGLFPLLVRQPHFEICHLLVAKRCRGR